MAQDNAIGSSLNVALFRALVGAEPYQWQVEAFRRLVQCDVPDRLLAPTAAGKVMMIPIWLAALATRAAKGHPGLQRRLVFVVNRRVLVDEATRLAEHIRDIVNADIISGLKVALASLSATGIPLNIATLRGQFADNGLWAEDPTTPAIILATPDMLGSRLLFRGYGLGRNRAAMQAGLLSMDTLVIHDEAHLAPAFGDLLRDIERRIVAQSASIGIPPLQVIEMTATDRNGHATSRSALRCDPAADGALRERMGAPKHLHLESFDKPEMIRRRIVEIIASHAGRRKAIAVFVSSPNFAQAIAAALTGTARRDRTAVGILPSERVGVLTGTMRGAERDALLGKAAWLRVSADRQDDEGETAVLIATSAGEIGIDLDADVLICDAATIDRQIQRFGRANRRGRTVASIHLVFQQDATVTRAVDQVPISKKKSKKSMHQEEANPVAVATELLARLPEVSAGVHDASPLALTTLRADPDYARAIDPAPQSRELEDGILELFASTSFSLRELAAPDPALWIHGLEQPDPEIELVWRVLPRQPLDEWLVRWPVHGRERVRLPVGKPTERFIAWIARRSSDLGLPEPVWLGSDGTVVDRWQGKLLPGLTLLIDHRAGGLADSGLVSEDVETPATDVSALQYPGGKVAIHKMVLNDEMEHWQAGEQEADSPEELIGLLHAGWSCVWIDVDATGTATAWLRPVDGHLVEGDELFTGHPRLLSEHLSLASRAAARIADRLPLLPELQGVLIRADYLHDLGKNWGNWQLSIGNHDLTNPLGKSGGSRFNSRLNAGYRHELGSLVDLDDFDPYVRHLIAAHHGYARPTFPERALSHGGCRDAAEAAQHAFDVMVARHGHWGTAYLEALVKCGDILAESQAATLGNDPVPTTASLNEYVGKVNVTEVHVPFSPANPGEYQAAIGLLWLLALRCPGARLAWNESGARYCGINEADVVSALKLLGDATASLDETRAALMLKNNPAQKYPPLRLSVDGHSYPINVWCNPSLSDRSFWRFAAGRSDGLETLGNLIAQCRASLPLPSPAGLLRVTWVEGLKPAKREPRSKAQRLRFDAATSWTALDVGWSPYAEDMAFSRPWIEVLALLGVQHTFPPPWHRDNPYATWRIPRSIRQVLVAARGLSGDTFQRFAPCYLSSGKNTDTFTAAPITTDRGISACPNLFVI